jgi:hypothetical protein
MARFDSATSFSAPVVPEVAIQRCAGKSGAARCSRSSRSRSAAGSRGLSSRCDAALSKSITT